ncbi:MAG: 1-deoxy-D-xylulose-5-phosphate synthase [Pseudomonadales bacterium]|nr:1-deoxy-D-xylulose-5-phosphate synthase [Pseudomonadales bacterium]
MIVPDKTITFQEIPENRPSTPLLDSVQVPADMRGFSEVELQVLANELREFMLYSVGQTGGHFGAGLGVVELTTALHYVFDTPEDRIVWDVGHQAYPHKILTGRRDQMDSIRLLGGLSGFPKRSESPFDTFGVGHSSTSISAALGMALAARQQNSERRSVAVIGDGAMTAGMAFEALNHAGHNDANLLVVLNDNDMSISKNVGGLSQYLARIWAGKPYTLMRESSKKILSQMPHALEFARRTEEHVKGMVAPGTLFEELGLNYIGPIDGHDLHALVAVLKDLRTLKGPQLLHVITHKGKGFGPAELDPIKYHAIAGKRGAAPAKKQASAEPAKAAAKKVKYSAVFGRWLCDTAAQDERLEGITPAMCEGSDMIEFARLYPKRYHDVGIAEQHAVTLGAGMACEGAKPVVAIYSTFLQRAYGQLIHDVAIQNLDVLFALDRAGLVGEDGPTHAGVFDHSYLRLVPNLVVMAPSDENELYRMLSTGYQYNGPALVRYPRGTGPGKQIDANAELLELGKGRKIRSGEKTAILAFGSMLAPARAAAEALNATLIDMRFVKPLDTELVLELCKSHDLLVTVEENVVMGGAGSGVNELLMAENQRVWVLNLGLPDRFVDHGTHAQLLQACGLDEAGILQLIRDKLDQLK